MLEIRDLSVSFFSYSFGLRKREITAIRSLDLSLAAGELTAVVGQSGAGKSLLAHAVLGILPRNARVSGELQFKGQPLTPDRMAGLRGREIALVPQSVNYLNPLQNVSTQVSRAAILGGVTPASARQATREALQRYGLRSEVAAYYPFQLSGGMARRVLTATATVGRADLILADEPTNGLDPATAAETLRHLRQLADQGKAVLLISHDLEAVLTVADTVTVFCGGMTVEVARAEDFNGQGTLRHPYSRALWAATPNNGFQAAPVAHKGRVHGGCPFAPQCNGSRSDRCAELPSLRAHSGGLVRCHHA